MGSTGIGDALFTRTQQRVLGLLFGQPRRRFAQKELIALARSGTGATQRELARLVASGLVTRTQDGRAQSYQADARSPVFAELCAIVAKTSGIAPRLRSALEPLRSRMALALLYGSVASGDDTAQSDIDVLIVGDTLTLEEIFRAFAPLEKELGRRIAPTLYTRAELERRRRERQPFVTKVFERKHVTLWPDAATAARESREDRPTQGRSPR
jgi:predicted nucleotidyltransferase